MTEHKHPPIDPIPQCSIYRCTNLAAWVEHDVCGDLWVTSLAEPWDTHSEWPVCGQHALGLPIVVDGKSVGIV